MAAIEVPRLRSSLSKVDSNVAPVDKTVSGYVKLFDKDMLQERKKGALDMTKTYYNLATDFYEYGWGECFHFFTLNKGETKEQAWTRGEQKMADDLGLKKGHKVLDMGCGIGGPARHIAAHSRASIVGLNYNEYQISRAKVLTEKENLQDLCTFIQGDFNDARDLEDDSFDHVYSIEATCHAVDKTKPYGEAYRVLKPGGLFAVQEWIVTDKFDPNNKEHQKIKADILEGNGLVDLQTKETVRAAVQAVGFELLEASDKALTSEVPWYSVLEPQWSMTGFAATSIGRWTTHIMLMTLETLRLVPKGSIKTHNMLCKGADGLVAAGRLGIFTPMYYFIAKKPEKESSK